jgi:hypothetical protein
MIDDEINDLEKSTAIIQKVQAQKETLKTLLDTLVIT